MKAPVKPKELAPEGVHPVTCIGFIDMGTQEPPATQPTWGESRKCSIEFEATGLKRKDGKPHIISPRFTFSGSPKSNLMKLLKQWLGIQDKNFDMVSLIGRQGLATIVHSDDGQYANITNLSEAPKGMKIKPALTPSRTLFLDPDDFDQDVFDSLHDSLKEKIMSSPEFDLLPNKGKKAAPVKKAKK